MKKIAGFAAGIAAVAVVGVAVAQGVPPNPFVTNHAVGAGQQNAHLAPMGETGTPWPGANIATAQIQQPAAVAIVEQPAPVAQVQETQSLGAAPAPQQETVAEVKPAKRDRG
ncbi:hypothetical protein [Ramlibacter albus]|uniref:Uncharacterized protein n=1 Tax=Ramlibacter albus TaxID=2079448 RepID=A0A923M6W1_9BURK|nr:hypothetical protein [Ramlibacter albus]MBC5765075.1 hypothetical protein [Ramlibacter albus]